MPAKETDASNQKTLPIDLFFIGCSANNVERIMLEGMEWQLQKIRIDKDTHLSLSKLIIGFLEEQKIRKNGRQTVLSVD